MQRSIGLKLSNLVTVIFVTSVICLVMACGLAVITGECDLFLFIQVMGYFFLVAASVLFFWMTFNIKNDGAFLWQVFLAALIFRVVAVVALYYLLIELQGNPYLEGYKDEFVYHTISLYFAKDQQAPLSDVQFFGLSENYGLYPYLVGFAYKLFGAHTLVARFLNAIIGAVCVIPFFAFIRNLGMKQETAKLAACFYVFSANIVLFNSVQLKDSLLLLLCFFLAYLGSVLMRTSSGLKVLLITILYFAVNFLFLFMRAQFFFLFTLFFFIFMFKRFLHGTSVNSHKILVLCVMALVVGMVVFLAFSRISSNVDRLSENNIEQQFSRYEKWQVSRVLGPVVPVITSTIGFFLPLPTLLKLANPDPGIVYSIDIFKIPTYFEIFFTSIIALSVIAAFRKARHPGMDIVFIMSVIFYALLIATGFVAYPRHKLFLIELFMIIMAYGIIETEIRWSRIFSFCMAGTVCVFLYNLIRLWVRE